MRDKQSKNGGGGGGAGSASGRARVGGVAGGAGDLPRVLVLDDHADSLALLGRLLSSVPVDAVPTATCEAARYAARTLAGFDVLIADAGLSKEDGDAVGMAAELKRNHGCGTVIVSGALPPADGLPEGVDRWMTKPVRLTELREAIRALVET